MKRIWILLAIVAVLLSAAVAVALTFPAAVAWGWVSERAPDVRLQGVDGTVWNGSATRISVRGQVLGRLQWQLSPWQLLSGNPRLHLEVDGPGLKLAGELLRHDVDLIAIEHLNVQTEAGWLAPALAIPELEPTGILVSEDASLILARSGLPRALDAHIEWREAGVRGQVIARLGTLMIDAQGKDGRIEAQVRDSGDGEVEIRGKASIDQNSYRSEVVLVPRVSDGPVVEALQWVGQPRPEGGRLLIVEGTIILPGASL
jgi:general secretion pathway protein N